MNTIMNKNLPLFDHSFSIPTHNDYLEMINKMIRTSNIDERLPTNMQDLDVFAQNKTPILNKYLQINLTKKKKNTARDIISDLFYNTTDGYQELQARWKKCYTDVIEALEKAKKLPEKVFVAMNAGQESAYLVDSELNIKCGDSDFLSYVNPDLGDEECWKYFTDEQSLILQHAYMISQMVAEENSNSSGFYHEDMEYFTNFSNIQSVGKTSYDCKYLNNDGDLIITMLVRPSIKDIDLIIKNLKELMNKNFKKLKNIPITSEREDLINELTIEINKTSDDKVTSIQVDSWVGSDDENFTIKQYIKEVATQASDAVNADEILTYCS